MRNALLMAGLLWPLSASAYRPFDGTDAAVADRGHVELEFGPVGLSKEGAETSLVAPSAILNWGFAERMELVLEGRQFIRLGEAIAWTRAHSLGLFGGAIFEVHDDWTVRPVAELFVEGQRDLPTAMSGLVGAIWRVRESLSADAGFRAARAGDATTTEIRVGVTWGFDLGFPRSHRGT